MDIPAPPFLGDEALSRLPLAELFDYFDLNTLYRLHWGAKNAKGEEYERLVREEYEPRLRRMKTEALTGGWLTPGAVYGYFPVAADGDALVVYDPRTPRRSSSASTSRGRPTATDCASPTTSPRR
jgi:5-methyltetrahydrofolate--homocysteine methyltransferase